VCGVFIASACVVMVCMLRVSGYCISFLASGTLDADWFQVMRSSCGVAPTLMRSEITSLHHSIQRLVVVSMRPPTPTPHPTPLPIPQTHTTTCRGAVASLREQASSAHAPAYVDVDWRLCHNSQDSMQVCHLSTWIKRVWMDRMFLCPLIILGPVAQISVCRAGCRSTMFVLLPSFSFQLLRGSCASVLYAQRFPCPPMEPRIPLPEEEIAYGPACWLWDYLRCVCLIAKSVEWMIAGAACGYLSTYASARADPQLGYAS
jgi:hypothetical protein